MIRRAAPIAVAALFAVMVLPGLLWSQTAPHWPSDQEKRLEQVDGQLLDVQRKRFRAIFFAKDKEAVKQLDEQYKSLQKEQRTLLDATGGAQ